MDKLGHGMKERNLWFCFPTARMCSSWQEKMPKLRHELPCEIGSMVWEGTCAFISLVLS